MEGAPVPFDARYVGLGLKEGVVVKDGEVEVDVELLASFASAAARLKIMNSKNARHRYILLPRRVQRFRCGESILCPFTSPSLLWWFAFPVYDTATICDRSTGRPTGYRGWFFRRF